MTATFKAKEYKFSEILQAAIDKGYYNPKDRRENEYDVHSSPFMCIALESLELELEHLRQAITDIHDKIECATAHTYLYGLAKYSWTEGWTDEECEGLMNFYRDWIKELKEAGL